MERDKTLLADMAFQYYERCETVYSNYDEDIRADYCLCTANAASSVLPPGQMSTLATGKGDLIEADIMAAAIQGPCIYLLFQEILFDYCLNDTRRLQYFTAQQPYLDYCSCHTDNVSEWLYDYGPDLMAKILIIRGEINDPVFAVQKDLDYRNQVDNWRTSCINEFAY